LAKRARQLDPADCDPRGVCHLITSSFDGPGEPSVDRDNLDPEYHSGLT
jgi:hypothetical protein